MGQKTNPNSFRLGINKIWKTEFFEKKSKELALYIYKDLGIKKYIYRFFELQGLFIYDYRHTFQNNCLNIYISYLVTSSFNDKKNLTNKRIIFINKKNNKKKIINNLHLNYKEFVTNNIRNILNLKNSNQKLKQYLNFINKLEKNKSLSIKTNTIQIFDHLIKVLNLFFKKQLKININFCCLNKNENIQNKFDKKYIMQLRKYKNTLFFKEGIETIFHAVSNKNSANLLAKFIADGIKKTKRHKFLVTFLKHSLTVLLNMNISKIKGIKIIVKGRINGVPRSRHKIISIGKIPTQSLNTNLDFSQISCHNSSGSYGIKVWIHLT